MSLIPSESASFSDLLGRGLDGSKKSKWRMCEVEEEVLPAALTEVSSTSPTPKANPDEAVAEKEVPAQRKRSQPAKTPAKPAKAAPKVVPEPAPVPVAKQTPAEPPVPVETKPVTPSLESILSALTQAAAASHSIENPAVAPISFMESQMPAAIPVVETPLREAPILPVADINLVPPDVPPTPAIPAAPPSTVAAQPPAIPNFAAPPVPPPSVPAPVQDFIPFQPAPESPLPEQAEPAYRPIPIVRRARSIQNPKGEPVTPIQSQVAQPPSEPFHPGEGRVRPNLTLKPRVDHVAAAQFPPAPIVQAAEARDAHVAWLPREPVNETISDEFHPAWEEEQLPVAGKIWRRTLDFNWESRFVRFVSYELVAIIILVVSAVIGIHHRTSDDPLNLLTKLVLIGSAIVATLIPVLFYGLPDRLPRDDR